MISSFLCVKTDKNSDLSPAQGQSAQYWGNSFCVYLVTVFVIFFSSLFLIFFIIIEKFKCAQFSPITKIKQMNKQTKYSSSSASLSALPDISALSTAMSSEIIELALWSSSVPALNHIFKVSKQELKEIIKMKAQLYLI